MLTEQHSEALAVWALRNRIWDYLVKPLTPLDLRRSVENSLSMRYGGQYGQRDNPIPPDLRFYKLHRKVTLPAEYFVENHYHEKIYEEHVAQLCGMKTCVFSRAFKKEHGTTFRRYLLEYRISKARELLRRPEVLVRDIAYTVGFRDPSYFTRIFRRIVGVSPLRYHERHAECEGNRKNLHHRDHHSGGYPNR
ncbi:MAG TPA: AraC family transcriptional regulator [Gammaproteobacteria bacterium]|nr:AraC family transcriptional regulator [Gammaproteobacteria bacterium]